MGGIVSAIKGALGLGNDSSASGVSADAQLQYVNNKWDERKNAFIVYHQAVWLSFLMYANQSWLEWDDTRKLWSQQPTDEWVPHPRINRFSPTIDAVVSNFATIPEIEAIPKPPDNPTSNMVVEVCNKLSEYIVVKEGLKHQIKDKLDKGGLAAQLFVLCGGLFSIIRVKKNSQQQPKQGMLQTYSYTCPNCDRFVTMQPGEPAPQFCPQCGNKIEAEEDQMMGPLTQEDGTPMMEETQGDTELDLEIGSTLWAFPRPGATSIEDSPDIIWGNRIPLDTIKYRWNFDADADAEWPDGYSVTYEHALNFWYMGYSSSSIQIKDSCMVKEMYVQPNKVKDFPDGFYQVVINNKPAVTEPWDFPEHPLTMAEYLRLPTIFFPRSIAFDLCEIQRELNAYESIIKLHGMTSAVDPILQDISTVVTEITGRSDKIIKYRKISPTSDKPERMGAGHLDDGIYKQRDNLHAEFQNISMAVNAFRGQQEGAITAASAIQQLRQQAELMFGKPSSNWNAFWTEVIRKYVKFMQHYFSFEQLVRIIGPGMEDEIRAFMDADLDVVTEWVSTTHGLPKTRDERRQEMMMLFQNGALDVSDPAVKQKLFELFGETGMMTAFNKNATNARLENQLIKTGGGQPGGPYMTPNVKPLAGIEDLNVHLYWHKDAVLSRDFQKWSDEAKQVMFQHIMDTQGELDNEQIAQATKMLTAQAASASVSALKKGGPHSGAAASSSAGVQQTALDSAKKMGQNVQGQDQSLAKPTPTGSAA